MSIKDLLSRVAAQPPMTGDEIYQLVHDTLMLAKKDGTASMVVIDQTGLLGSKDSKVTVAIRYDPISRVGAPELTRYLVMLPDADKYAAAEPYNRWTATYSEALSFLVKNARPVGKAKPGNSAKPPSLVDRLLSGVAKATDFVVQKSANQREQTSDRLHLSQLVKEHAPADGMGLLDIVRELRKAGHRVFIVGGAVRDFLLGKEPNDVDLATTATPEQVMDALAGKAKVNLQGMQFAVVVVNGYEIASLRKDTYNVQGKPEVETITDIREDVVRRDFTINAVVAEIDEHGGLHLLDYVGGQADLKEHKVIRAVGDPVARFHEDYIRMLRAVTFAARLGFDIEPATAQAIRQHRDLLKAVPGERIAKEITKMLEKRVLHRGLKVMKDLGLIPVIFPELAQQIDLPQNPAYHHLPVFEHTVAVVEHAETSGYAVEIVLAALYHDAAKGFRDQVHPDGRRERFHNKNGQPTDLEHEKASAPLAEQGVLRLLFGRSTAQRVSLLVRFHGIRPSASPKSVVKTINDLKASPRAKPSAVQSPVREEIEHIQKAHASGELTDYARDLLVSAAKMNWSFTNRSDLKTFIDELFLLIQADAAGFAPHFSTEIAESVRQLKPMFDEVLERVPFFTSDVPGITEAVRQEQLQGPAIGERLEQLIVEAQNEVKQGWTKGASYQRP